MQAYFAEVVKFFIRGHRSNLGLHQFYMLLALCEIGSDVVESQLFFF